MAQGNELVSTVQAFLKRKHLVFTFFPTIQMYVCLDEIMHILAVFHYFDQKHKNNFQLPYD